jgi:hypothetical protein
MVEGTEFESDVGGTPHGCMLPAGHPGALHPSIAAPAENID